MADETNLPENHIIVAELMLSSEKIRIGFTRSSDNYGTIFVQHESMPEPTYMSRSEARLLYRALKTTLDVSIDPYTGS